MVKEFEEKFEKHTEHFIFIEKNPHVDFFQ